VERIIAEFEIQATSLPLPRTNFFPAPLSFSFSYRRSFTSTIDIYTTAMETLRNADIFSRIQPHEYMRRFIDQKVRPDGRLLDRFRDTSITSNVISTANASAMVRLGNTTVVCGIKAEVSEPDLKHPDQGFLGKLILFLCSMRVI
jgi:hypothetical protein